MKRILQMNHDIANLVQVLIALSEDIDIDRNKLKLKLHKLSLLIKIYSGIYCYANFEELVELIQEYNDFTIELSEDFDIENQHVAQVVLIYCLWITKTQDIVLQIKHKAISINFEHKRDKHKMFEEIIEDISTTENIKITTQETKIDLTW